MHDILLTTINAKYIHSSLGLRYLYANMRELQSRTRIFEFTLDNRPIEIADRLLRESPRIIGLGVYIWNVTAVTELVSIIKKASPGVCIVLGGPEISHEFEITRLYELCDHLIVGEADLAFAELCTHLLSGTQSLAKVIRPELPSLDKLNSPYSFYTDDDLANRLLYVEASRGCPFSCDFCLSSLDTEVRRFPLEPLLHEIRQLIDRGGRRFKFVDRTFNIDPRVSKTILEFFLEHADKGTFAHFEIVPDRLPAELRELIRKFPPSSLQFEAGIQSFNPFVSGLIHRKQDYDKTAETIHFLRNETTVNIHADLVAGLPGENLDSFAAGFDRLVRLGPQEIQVGILKRLKGAPISRHDEPWGMVYSEYPPYEILRTSLIDFQTLHRLRRFARYWELYYNRGEFTGTIELLWKNGSPFRSFMEFSDWLFERSRATHKIALHRLHQYLDEYLAKPDESKNRLLNTDL